MARYAVIDNATHEVKNIIVWDGITQWQPPVGTYIVQHDYVSIGDIHLHLEKDPTFVTPNK